MAEHAMGKSIPRLAAETDFPCVRRDQHRAMVQVANQWAALAGRDPLLPHKAARVPEVVQDGGAHEQVPMKPAVYVAELGCHPRHRDRVLQ